MTTKKEKERQISRKLSWEGTINNSTKNINMQIERFINLMEKYSKQVLKYKKDHDRIDSTIKSLKNSKMKMKKLNTYFKNAPIKIFKEN